METASYACSVSLGAIDFGEAERKVARALKDQGFGILTEIDVKATLKMKLDVDFRRYKILGACNPPLAHRALSSELLIGLLLPCNVIVYEQDDGQVIASFVNAKEMFKVVENEALACLAGEVDAKIRAAMAALG